MTGQSQGTVFERIRHDDEDGNEYWSARELAKALGYSTNFRNFLPVVKKAEEACQNSEYAVSDHFAHVRKMVGIGSKAQRAIEDAHLSRYACYLIVQNADPEKPIVALGQTYFAVQTRRAELADEATKQLTDRQRRIYTRDEIAEHNTNIADELSTNVGAVSAQDFAIFTDFGYKGLYNGETARDIHTRKGLKKNQKILDWMGSTELAANLFRTTQAEEKLLREGITDKNAANQMHHEVGREVRETIKRLGGTMPEDLPTPDKSIQQLRREEQQHAISAAQRKLRPPLFDA